MLRIGLFLLTNLAIIIVAGISLSLLGVNSILADNGVDLNLTSLLIFCAVFGFIGSFISLLLSKFMAKMSTKTKIIQQPKTEQERWLMTTMAELAKKADIGMPEVGIFPAQQSNAFATGWNRNKALVAVSAGLLARFDRDEARAVLAHEIGHVANGDMITLTLVQGVVNTFVMFFARLIGFFVDRVVLKNQRGLGIGYWITTIIAEIFLAILASTIVLWFSRRREFSRRCRRCLTSWTRRYDQSPAKIAAGDRGPSGKPDARYHDRLWYLFRMEKTTLETVYVSPTT